LFSGLLGSCTSSPFVGWVYFRPERQLELFLLTETGEQPDHEILNLFGVVGAHRLQHFTDERACAG
ncbi:MAG: hypothetical protein Q8L87_20960, partial [Anaerolineales bacterium]|nr:hypothetical protein [Anaerolineales bacterium]